MEDCSVSLKCIEERKRSIEYVSIANLFFDMKFYQPFIQFFCKALMYLKKSKSNWRNIVQTIYAIIIPLLTREVLQNLILIRALLNVQCCNSYTGFVNHIDTSSCGTAYRITLGSTGSEHQPSTEGLYKKVCTASDDTFIYKKDDDSFYLFYVEFNSAPFWAISNKIGGSSMIIKSISSSPPYCPGPESNGVWLIITGTGSGDVRFLPKVN